MAAIRKAATGDLEEILSIYSEAREFMRESGNPDQWKDHYPPRELIEKDIQTGKGCVCAEKNEVAAAFYFNVERDPTYERIDGEWLNNEPYGVIHRIAKRRGAKGAGAFCINWCYEQYRNIKIDTHRDNLPMRKLLGKLGFVYCGIIWLETGEERLAFQKTT